jgi:hypothetical protein
LKSWGNSFVNAREVARRAGGRKKFGDDPEWAKPVLVRMTERSILESDSLGRYRVKPVSKKDRQSRWVSPDIAKILEESGVKVEGVTEGAETASDEYYDQL